ncbi:MAG: sugar phosphate isomerase/epimerase [Oscillospiraceae bacterium]|nr:sugar phosphate isomerase/epimerase [Oscillospiraceae bacterium]
MNRFELQERLYLSGMDENALQLAKQYGLGFEVTEFCYAAAMDAAFDLSAKCSALSGVARLWFHAPFAELSPCAIDPKIRALTAQRYRQSIELALQLGIRRIVIHSGFIPLVYFPEWFVPESIRFWREFLQEMPQDILIALENVMDSSPQMLVDIAEGVGDPRFGLCLDLGHANSSISETAPLDWIEPMLPWLRHVHLHSNEGGWDIHAPLGSGTVPAGAALDLLLDRAPAATFTIENMDCRDSLRWLEEHGYLRGNK